MLFAVRCVHAPLAASTDTALSSVSSSLCTCQATACGSVVLFIPAHSSASPEHSAGSCRPQGLNSVNAAIPATAPSTPERVADMVGYACCSLHTLDHTHRAPTTPHPPAALAAARCLSASLCWGCSSSRRCAFCPVPYVSSACGLGETSGGWGVGWVWGGGRKRLLHDLHSILRLIVQLALPVFRASDLVCTAASLLVAFMQLPCALTSSPRCAGSFCVRVAVIPLHVQGGDLDTQEQSVTPSTLMRLTMSNMQPHDTKLW
jgi:hypothetical protein